MRIRTAHFPGVKTLEEVWSLDRLAWLIGGLLARLATGAFSSPRPRT